MYPGHDMFCQGCDRSVPHEVALGGMVYADPEEYEPQSDECATLCADCWSGYQAFEDEDDDEYEEW